MNDKPQRHVALVNMPFATADRPSIQCGLLAGALSRRGHVVEILDFNLELAAHLGAETYARLARMRSEAHIGDWLFSAAAFDTTGGEDVYRREIPEVDRTCERLGCTFDVLCELRRERIPAFLMQCLEDVDWGRFDAVGFTSTFEQQVAALALARRLKERFPAQIMIFGGANISGEMGLEFLRAFSWIDVVVLGEGDDVLPAVIGSLAEAGAEWPMPGTAVREASEIRVGSQAPIVDLDELPDPEYGPYFERLARLGRAKVLGDAAPQLPFEASRGCWWGQKRPCGFCGLNGPNAKFRGKSPDRLKAELLRLSARHRHLDFEAVDRILDPAMIDRLLNSFADGPEDFAFFFEVKSSLDGFQLGRLSRAGVTEIQPGIESLSTRLLGLMHKGTTLLENVRCLGWASHHGMQVGWNILMGIPGEKAEDYEEQARIVPLLHHLPPPHDCGRIWLDRYSPFFLDASSPFHNRRPRAAYRHIYSGQNVDLKRIAYFWDYELEGAVPDERTALLRERVSRWQALWQGTTPPTMVARRGHDWLLIDDQREPGVRREHLLMGPEVDLYLACGETHGTPEQFTARLAGRGAIVEASWAAERLEVWREKGLALADGGRYLGLALPPWRARRDLE